jgi:hypothetical protein
MIHQLLLHGCADRRTDQCCQPAIGCDAAAGSFTAGYVRNYQNLNAHVSGAAFPLAKAFAQVHCLRQLLLSVLALLLWPLGKTCHTQ